MRSMQSFRYEPIKAQQAVTGQQETSDGKSSARSSLIGKRFEVTTPAAGRVDAVPRSNEAERHGSRGDGEGDGELEQTRLLGLGRCGAACAVVMVVAAVGCFAASIQVSPAKGSSEVSPADRQAIFDLRERIALTESREEALPDRPATERGLVTARESATRVADLQNQYRVFSPAIGDDGGALGRRGELGEEVVRDLRPYFTTGVDLAVLEPWYLLASDTQVPVGSGLPATFRSGFHWVAQDPYGIDQAGVVRVSWLALETNEVPGARPRVLAWAQADYDLVRKVFSGVRTGTTVQGETLRLEVR